MLNLKFSSRLPLLPALLAITLMGLASYSQAGKLYKIVDADGKITFSQYPPAEKSDEQVVEGIKLKGDAQLAVSKRGNLLYCGETRLPNAPISQSQQSRFLQELTRKQKSWQQQLDRVEQQVERDNYSQFKNGKKNYYNDSYKAQKSLDYQKRKDRNIKQMKELRCAIDWSKSKQGDVDRFTSANTGEVARLRKVFQNLEVAMQTRCGDEPLLDPGDPVATRERKEWKSCTKKYRQDLRQVDRELRKASSNIRRIY